MTELLFLQTAAVAVGFIIDFFVGDPHFIPHPVVFIGKLISLFEKLLRRGGKKDIARGALASFCVVLISTALPALLLFFAFRVSRALYFAIECVMCWQLIAARQLVRESRAVQKELEKGDLEGARRAVSMIVGRDTERLDEPGVCRAAVETVAENASDGVISPLFYMLFFGAVGGFFCKAVNTLDSMIGYKNDKYLYFGRVAAKTDDAVNFIPARLSAVLMIAACPFLGLDTKNARKIFLRDRKKHASPNSAQTESVCAGALGLRLAGDAYYGGVLHKKEFIGDPLREIEPRDITLEGKHMYLASALMLWLVIFIRTAVILCL